MFRLKSNFTCSDHVLNEKYFDFTFSNYNIVLQKNNFKKKTNNSLGDEFVIEQKRRVPR